MTRVLAALTGFWPTVARRVPCSRLVCPGLPSAHVLADRSLLGERQSAFLFARFENAPGEEDNGVVVNVVGKQPGPGVRSARGSWSARSFRNPLFDQDDSAQPAARGVAHENPLFSELQRRSAEDRDDEEKDEGVLELGEESGGANGVAEAATAPTASARQKELEAAVSEEPLVDVTL